MNKFIKKYYFKTIILNFYNIMSANNKMEPVMSANKKFNYNFFIFKTIFF